MSQSVSILLASKSPRRQELLTQIGVKYSLVDVDVPEERQPLEPITQYVERLALSKARAGSVLNASKPVLGADTVVVLGEQLLEKPIDKAHGINMLLALSGKTHKVYTAVALCQQQREFSLVCCSSVSFREISRHEAEQYWLTGEPKDKAGGYGIQGLAAVFVEALEGSYSNVVGLPLMEAQKLLQQFQVPVWNSSINERSE